MSKVDVLVYGSLKHSCGNNDVMQNIGAKCLGYDSITGEFEMISLGPFPGVVWHRNPNMRSVILGELYTVDYAGLASLDAIEGHPHWYRRIKFRTDIMGRDAWLYILPKDEGHLDSEYDTSTVVSIWRPTEDEQNFWRNSDVTIKNK